MSCCWQLLAVAVRDSARLLGLLCSGFAVCGGFAKDLLMVSSRTLTAAGAAGQLREGGSMGQRMRNVGGHGSGIRTAAAAAL
jgi:hypothetical protein